MTCRNMSIGLKTCGWKQVVPSGDGATPDVVRNHSRTLDLQLSTVAASAGARLGSTLFSACGGKSAARSSTHGRTSWRGGGLPVPDQQPRLAPLLRLQVSPRWAGHPIDPALSGPQIDCLNGEVHRARARSVQEFLGRIHAGTTALSARQNLRGWRGRIFGSHLKIVAWLP